jgi:hypothetical protein
MNGFTAGLVWKRNASLYADYRGRAISIIAGQLQLIADSSDLFAAISDFYVA